jgi:SAM-dependent methyltransferase
MAAKLLTLESLLPYMCSPDSGEVFQFNNGELRTSQEIYPLTNGCPYLVPTFLQEFLNDGRLIIPPEKALDPRLHYFYLSSVKQNHPTPNSLPDDPWLAYHHRNCKEIFQECNEGLTLDIGCDSPEANAKLFPSLVQYVGLDVPLGLNTEFKVIGLGEFLPFQSSVFDNVCIMGSLDHFLDHHRAIDEAYRVLKPGGKLFMSVLVWINQADLLLDTNHFHHFREFEVLGALTPFFQQISTRKLDWKNNVHRKVMYLIARKP